MQTVLQESVLDSSAGNIDPQASSSGLNRRTRERNHVPGHGSRQPTPNSCTRHPVPRGRERKITSLTSVSESSWETSEEAARPGESFLRPRTAQEAAQCSAPSLSA
ncbi:LIM domain-containing protein 2 isoform X4 [Poecile atricapillus]|uniref:LIM domain-containing protein 2 isoform X4 n=1 Tax=Poecile atricapillus TaxID=48891 RepID=UPI0027382D52|nr:LIM domain-containing protein 2 isoform X4 [Poecile atricapillus]